MAFLFQRGVRRAREEERGRQRLCSICTPGQPSVELFLYPAPLPPTFPDGPGNELLVSSQGRAFRLNFMLLNSKKAWLCARLRLPFRSPRFPKPSPSS